MTSCPLFHIFFFFIWTNQNYVIWPFLHYKKREKKNTNLSTTIYVKKKKTLISILYIFFFGIIIVNGFIYWYHKICVIGIIYRQHECESIYIYVEWMWWYKKINLNFMFMYAAQKLWGVVVQTVVHFFDYFLQTVFFSGGHTSISIWLLWLCWCAIIPNI